MPAGVRLQQLTPVVRPASNQAATIVRLMSPMTSTIRPGTGQQQIIQLSTTKQQQSQPLVIKAITAPAANRHQQQPILLTTNAQQKTIATQPGTPQILLLNQNSFNNHFQGSQPKLTLQMTNVEPTTTTTNHTDHQSHEPTTNETNLPQLDGIYTDESAADQMDTENTIERILHQIKDEENSSSIVSAIPQLDGTVDDQVSSPRFAFEFIIVLLLLGPLAVTKWRHRYVEPLFPALSTFSSSRFRVQT